MSAAAPGRRHRQVVTDGETTYIVRVGGTVDGESLRDPVGYGNYGQAWENNLRVRLANTGDEAIVNPWVDVGGHRRWRSLAEILAGILAPDMAAADQARAIWEFARSHRYHFTSGDDEVKDTVKMLNVYGYTLCWDEAYTVSNLWQAAGLRVRRGLPHGHCTSEVFFDGKFHLLDSDEHLLVLERDNETIAGEAEISRDHDLMKRSHAYGILSPEDRRRAEQAAALFCHTGPRSGGRRPMGGHRMELVLRPGEALVWAWDHRGRYHGRGAAPPRFCNGALEFEPRLDDSFARWVEAAEGAGSDGAAVTADAVTWTFAAPYVVVGGRLELHLGPAPVRVEVRPGQGDWIEVGTGLHGQASLDLDPCFPADGPACYGGALRLSGAAFTVHSLRLEATLQMAPLSLPALCTGDNTVRYRDDSRQRRVEITHQWQERHDLRPPPAPVSLDPVPGSTVRGTAPTLRWSDTAGDGGDYHLRLGRAPGPRWALSPVFEKLVSNSPSRGLPRWTVPQEGLLNPDTAYAWQVRARTADGLWGPWSAAATFTPKAPGLPLQVGIDMDWERRRGTLRWRPNPAGTPLVRWEVYGSDERGFSASRQPREIVSGASDPGGTRTVPANLVATVEASATHLEVVGAGLGEHANRAFYRVVAVDPEGARSAPSDLTAAPRPFVYTSLPDRIPAARATRLTLRAIHTLGDLRAESDGPHRYRLALRDGDRLDWILDEGPAFIALDAASGVMTLTPGEGDTGTHTVTVRVRSGQGGVDAVGFDLEVVA